METILKLRILFWISFSSFIVHSFVLGDVSDPQIGDFSLPGNLIPESYNLTIYTNLNEKVFAFSGSVYVKVLCIQGTNKIILHAKNLTIIEEYVTVMLDENNVIEIQSHEYDRKIDFYTINLKTYLQPENIYFVYIPFEAKLGTDGSGYSGSSYTDAQGNIRWISVTQFDPIYARKAFPCWDELGYKAKYNIFLAHDENLTAISNMRLASIDNIENMPGWVMSKFDESPPIPTTNVAFVICDFVSKNVELPPRNIQLRVWAREELLYQAELALDTLSKALPFDEYLFDMLYPLPKMDIVALPYYSAGSESNFGLALITETGVLFDQNSNGDYNRRNIVSDVCGMVNQQWFNNIVTAKGWEGMWLGSGFVNYFSKTVVDQLYPDWSFGFRTFANEFSDVLAADSSKTAHALQVIIESPDVINQFYDTITFTKSAYVLRMLNIIIGNDSFQLGVNNFLKEYKFKKADQFDLWKMLANANNSNNVDIQRLMDPWTLKPGFPYLFVDINYSQQTVTVTQERFLFNDKNEEEEAERKKYCWPVALIFTTSINPNFEDLKIQQWLTCHGPLTFSLELKETDWVIFNLGLVVPCRINYSGKNWDSILKTLANENGYQEIEVRNRMQIVDDLFAFATADILAYSFVLDAIMYLQYENDYLPWGIALSYLRDIRSYLMRTELFEPFQAYVRKMLEPVYYKLGKFEEFPTDYYRGEFKYQMTFWSCEYWVDSCRKSCLESLRSWKAVAEPDQYNPILLQIRGYVYCQALRIGDESDWYFLWDRYLNARGPLDKGIILQTLGCTQRKNILQNLLNWSIDPNVFQPEDSPEVFLRVADSGVAYEMCRDFFINRFQEIYNYLSEDPDLLGRYLPILYALTRTQEELKVLNDFVDTIRPQLVGTELSLNDAIDFANFILAWIDKNKPVFTRILQNYGVM